MKSSQIQILILLALASILTSCSMDKRIYSLGYHTQWNTGKKHSIANTPNSPSVQTSISYIPEANEIIQNTLEDNEVSINKNQMATNDNKTIILSNEVKNYFLGKPSAYRNKESPISQLNSPAKIASIKDSKNLSVIAIAGFVCSIIGVALIFNLSLSSAILFLILGIVLSLIGLIETNININNRNKRGKGFAIAGLIIGMLPFLILFLLLMIVYSMW
jgi:hypothetical protein